MIQQHLRALREHALAVVETIDLVLADFSPAVAVAEDAPCEHPAPHRLARPVMGRPTAWICKACLQEGD